MNYIIWKNKNSRTLKGLLISELPPISKPLMRVQETTIDGVDGSIIEELGYESYDKTLQIGLFGSFNIDEIIEYFSGAGQIVFSNEPDKYYNARIVNQIDYERLLRFRTASITFRVQPFKYEYQEENDGFTLNDAGGINLFKATSPSSANGVEVSYADSILTLKSTGTSSRYASIYNIDAEIGDVIRFSTILLDSNSHVLLQEYTPDFVQVAYVYAVYNDGVTPSLLEYRKKDANNRTRLVFYTDYNVPTGERIARYKDCILTINHEDMTFKEYDVAETIESISLNNKGNYFSKPIIKIVGTGTIELTVNGNKLFSYTFPEDETEVIIDSQKQDAYLGAVLKNRNMSGEFPTLEIGENTITWDGTITSIKISSQSRWL